MVVDGCPTVSSVNGSCCELQQIVQPFKFTEKTPLQSRIYYITNFCGENGMIASGYCDAATDGGGWLVIQRRQDGSVDFNRNWKDYEDGFGSLSDEFWYGLTAIHCLTSQGQWELRIDYKQTDGIEGYMSYSSFRVGPATTQYILTISGYSGTTNDPFSSYPLNGMKFSTKDRDNDKWGSNCAVNDAGGNGGGWWYNACSNIRLNHQYKSTYSLYVSSKWRALSFVEMKIRPKSCAI
ncbi:fibrinogen-like protein A [Dysidea avara]|uniref:fibrinogen-like protein A n=1 Tax=Dysidea avara TaxID=196820 RepID=UPI003331C6F7